ncbi:MAG TPA: primase C-terminal domain-containing protein, partial [Candidatus Binatia bacterium]|nr:primase C-terminal domain-containing protein [Candidatus Binatia bacterium]
QTYGIAASKPKERDPMSDATHRYIEVCEGFSRGMPPEMIKTSDLAQWKSMHESSNAGLFSSIYSYSTQDPHVGDVISDFYLDFDNQDNPNKAIKEAIAAIKKLQEEHEINESFMTIAFSGMKGVSVTIKPIIFNAESSESLPLIWKSIARELAQKLRLKTIDLGIYDRRRIWRVLNSRHNKTGLYKIPLTLIELENLNIDQIKELAIKPRELPTRTDHHPLPEAEGLYLQHKERVETWLSIRKQKFEATREPQTTEDPPCIKAFLEKGAEKGQRNLSTFQLALYLCGKQLATNEIEFTCMQFAAKSTEPLSEGEIASIVDSAVKGYGEGRYSVGCSTFADLCDRPKCPLFVTDSKPNWDSIGTPITFDEWKNTIQNNFPDLWFYAEAAASVAATLNIKDVQPLALVLQGVPSGGKTTVLDFFCDFPLSHATDKFTARSFVSHVAQKSEEELKKIDLLPRIKGKVLLTPDLTTLFGAKAEDLQETFSLLTRVLDGRGLTIDSGVYGARGYKGDYHFTWLGATTPIPHRVWDLFGNLGARMYFLQVLKHNRSNQDYIDNLKLKNYRKKVDECNIATLRFLKGIWQPERIEWDGSNDSDDLIEKLVQTAKIVTRLRGKINVVVKDDQQGRQETFFSEAIIEEPDRCLQALYALMRGHALLQGRRSISIDDLPVVLDVALSSAPWDRILALSFILSNNTVTTSQLQSALRCSRGKAIRTMETLKLLDLVKVGNTIIQTYGGEQHGFEMSLKKEFKWFQSDEFKQLWRQKTEYPDMPIQIKTEAELQERLSELKEA